jgi:hypothetical protein
MKRIWHNISVLITAALALLACEDAVELDVGDFESRMVVISNFTPNEPVEVFVSKTQSILDHDAPHYLPDAIVELYHGEQFLERLEFLPATETQPPRYVSRQYQPRERTLYRLHVDAPTFDPVQAQSSIPQAATIRSLRVDNVQVQRISPDSLAYLYRVEIVFADPPNVKNFYHLNFQQQTWNYRVEEGDTLIVGDNFRNINFSSENDNNSFIAYFDGGVLFDDTSLDGRLVAYSFVLRTNIQPSSEIIGKMFAELRTTSEDYFLYHNSLSRQQTSPDGPLAEPVIVYNNIVNGRGIFAGYNPAIDSVVIR